MKIVENTGTRTQDLLNTWNIGFNPSCMVPTSFSLSINENIYSNGGSGLCCYARPARDGS